MGNILSFVSNQVTVFFDLLAFAKNPRQGLLTCRAKYGDVFLIDCALVGTKIAGLCGPEALEQFEAKVLDGSLVKKDAFPASVATVLGPILSVLDGEVHDDRKRRLMEAFTATQLELYKPVIRRIVQTEHLRWVKSSSSSFSLVASTKTLLFKVMLAVLYGINDDAMDAYLDFVVVIDDYVASIQRSAKQVDPRGIETRAKFIDELIGPAIDAAKVRVATHETKPSLLDFLVQAGKFTDDELRQEGFHMMFASFGGLSTLAANMITALTVYPDVRKKAATARTTLVAQFPTEDSRWAHVTALGYLNQFVLEVKRFYIAGPTQVFTRATRDVDINTVHGSIKIPKGALVLAGLEATSKHPGVWADADTFNPDRFEDFELDQNLYKFCPHSMGPTQHRRCAGGELSTVILNSVLLSYLDFTWEMVPDQDFTLQLNSVVAVPVGQLMVSAFEKVPVEQANWPFKREM
ncbi:Aste57867_11875 [Aphanomyces stellatus]|uniref:Aste57867_11875 protein n=1 Tax=Aphanomyces stellatus TaxID=120398 RepID=A0A485KU54_9STRA|nr:hypothetical protein As57867_011830 [Aphanomyces stellatus]VFT88730.1 Aste57867_11875 [Aphanomyces stellatus]